MDAEGDTTMDATPLGLSVGGGVMGVRAPGLFQPWAQFHKPFGLGCL